MKASDLIQKLTDLVSEHGDLNISLYDDVYGYLEPFDPTFKTVQESKDGSYQLKEDGFVL